MLGQFSEFSYGFALAYELCNRAGPLTVAPLLPSLQEEGRAGGGFDIRIEQPGIPLFLQFKLSEYMVRASAGEWAEFREPYYRFWIHARRHSLQHDLLLSLDDGTAEVLYAAPRFHVVSDLNAFFTSKSVERNSIFFSPAELGHIADDDSHPVAFGRDADHGYLYSEPKRTRARFDRDGLLLAIQKRALAEKFVKPTAQLFQRLYSTITERVGPTESWLPSEKFGDTGGSPLVVSRARAAFAARVFLGAELLWLTAP